MRLSFPLEQHDAQLLSEKSGRAHGIYKCPSIPYTWERGAPSIYEYDHHDAVQDEAELLKLEAKLVIKPEHLTQHQEDYTREAIPLCSQSAAIH